MLGTNSSSKLSEAQPTLQWTERKLGEYLKSCEGRVWQHKDTQEILQRAAQIDTLIVRLMRAAGVEIVE